MSQKRKKKTKKSGNNTYVRKIRIARYRDGEIYGVVLQMLGNSRLRVYCFDGKIRTARIRGKLVKRMWIREEDVVVVSPWEFQDEKGDVVYRYTRAQVTWLQRKGYIPENYLDKLTENL